MKEVSEVVVVEVFSDSLIIVSLDVVWYIIL